MLIMQSRLNQSPVDQPARSAAPLEPRLDQAEAERFVASALRNTVNAELLRRLPRIGLPDCWLVAGCLFQAVWNETAERAADAGVKDYDIFYFDDGDVSYEAEDLAIARVRSALADLNIAFDVKNQARVHLWYEQRFGNPYPQLMCAQDGINRFLVAGTCFGLSPRGDGTADLYAPYGLGDSFDGILRASPLTIEPSAFLAKAENYRARWPHLKIDPTSAPMPQRTRQTRIPL